MKTKNNIVLNNENTQRASNLLAEIATQQE